MNPKTSIAGILKERISDAENAWKHEEVYQEFIQSVAALLSDSDDKEYFRNALTDVILGIQSSEFTAGKLLTLRCGAWIIQNLMWEWGVVLEYGSEFTLKIQFEIPPECVQYIGITGYLDNRPRLLKEGLAEFMAKLFPESEWTWVESALDDGNLSTVTVASVVLK